jgi:hypothetical protein
MPRRKLNVNPAELMPRELLRIEEVMITEGERQDVAALVLLQALAASSLE